VTVPAVIPFTVTEQLPVVKAVEGVDGESVQVAELYAESNKTVATPLWDQVTVPVGE
jgi:hypothetical protein